MLAWRRAGALIAIKPHPGGAVTRLMTLATGSTSGAGRAGRRFAGRFGQNGAARAFHQSDTTKVKLFFRCRRRRSAGSRTTLNALHHVLFNIA
jgi:hypothetical protein